MAHHPVPPAPMVWQRGRPYEGIIRAAAEDGGLNSDYLAETRAYCERMGSDFTAQSDRGVFISILRDIMFNAPHGDGISRVESVTALRVMEFHAAGRQIFRFDAALTTELSRTDVDDVLIEDVRTPYGTFYLMFDRESVAGLEDVQGVIVTNTGGSLEMATMTNDEDGPRELLPFTMRIDAQYESVGASLDAAYRAADIIAEDPDIVPEINTERLVAGSRVQRLIMPLIVNALLYIDNCGAAAQPTWPDDAPADLVTKAAGRVGARKAEQALTRQGWTKTRLCALDTPSPAIPDGAGDREPSRRVGRHWRRGHWRRITRDSGVRLVRVRPTMVGTGPLAEGRTYDTRLR